MTELSQVWDGTTVGDATNAPYSAAEWAQNWRELLHGTKVNYGPLYGTGVSPDPGLTVRATTPASMAVEVLSGAALVQGILYRNTATATLTIGANASGLPRIDTVVLRASYAAQTVRLAVIQGTPAVSPVPLALTQTAGVTWEIPLADIRVSNGAVTIAQGVVHTRHDWSNAAWGLYVEGVLNNSGGPLQTGDVVSWDNAAVRAVTASNILGNPLVAGVWQGYTAAGGYGRMLVHGIGYVDVDSAVPAINTVLIPQIGGDTTPVAVLGVPSKRNAVGISLETTAATGLCLAYIDIGAQRDGAIVSNETGNGPFVQNNGAFTDLDATAIVTIVQHTGRVRVTMQFAANCAVLGYFDIYSDGLAMRGGDVNTGLNFVSNFTSCITLVAIFTGLTPGNSETFRLQVKSGTPPNNVTILDKVFMHAEEI